MNVAYEPMRVPPRPAADVRAHPFSVLRVCWRLPALFLCILAFHGMIRVLRPLGFRRTSRRLALAWVRTMGRLLGMRVQVAGTPPSHPYFVVMNHMSWLDLFGAFRVLDGTAIAEDPLRQAPLVGAIVSALDPIFVRRVREDTLRVKNAMADALRAGRSLMLAPETPATTAPLGSVVRMFRAGLLESAIETRTPVHYMSITYRTPASYPPPSKRLVFGPNPWFRDADGKIPESELAAFGGKEHSFAGHVLGVLALPWHECLITFGDRPVTASDRITLANRLHQAVDDIFRPIA